MPGPPPVVLRGAGIPGSPRAVDVRLADGVVAAVVDAGDRDLRRTGDDVLDAAGAVLLPGLVDGHVHWTQWAQHRRRVDVSAAAGPEDAARMMAEAPSPGAGMLVGRGFRAALWATPPHKDVLERALPGVPVALVSDDIHVVWCSPAALAQLGRDHPTGVLREHDAFVVAGELTAAQPPGVLDAWAADAATDAARRGLTGILDFEYGDTTATWARRAAAGALPLRVRTAVWEPWLDAALAARVRTGDVVAGTGGLVTVGPFKVLADGSLNTRTAACHHPYPDPADGHGVLAMEPDALHALMRRAAAGGLTPAVHAIGDRAAEVVLDGFASLTGPGRVEHAQLVAPADLPRFRGLVASVQPQHAPADRDVAERHWAAVTPRAFPFADLAAAGARLELGSDAPVSPPDPWAAIADAVARTDDERPPWHPEQALDLPTALRAAAAGRDLPGPGDPADLVLVGADPLRLTPSHLREMPVLATLRGGVFTHRTR